ncbi:M20/M25/M40 family metallo-hydrolase [Oleiharenicola sp. Vm1]|uniref:M20/M25/M40 family metallo-hydrolase n=1 Tax=Oleiharenicola sp. Vm1 TaxID=3398393 RepID=UPI0039F4634C
MSPRLRLLPALALLLSPLALRAALTPEEERIAAYIDAHRADFVRDLEAAVKIDSATENLAGVRAMSDFFGAQLSELGFAYRFAPLPAETKRAGHLVAERTGTRGQRVLLIGHLDSVLPGGAFRLEGDKAYGAGTSDIKGGDLVLIYALKALHAAGALENTRILVVMTGDEEAPGQPLAVSRRDLWDAAKRSDLALAFEGSIGHTATVARRGIISWELEVQGATGHSSAIFAPHMGSGAVFEMARILGEFHDELRKIDGVTCNPALVVGGTEAELDRLGGKVTGKSNIVAQRALVRGDLRFLSAAQKEEVKARMRAIVARHLPRTSAELRFPDDGYPAMEATPENAALLRQLDAVSRDLGYGAVEAYDPKSRGAGDASFVSPPLPALDGLGASGRGAHAPGEFMDLGTMPEMVKRTAVLLYRLTR